MSTSPPPIPPRPQQSKALIFHQVRNHFPEASDPELEAVLDTVHDSRSLNAGQTRGGNCVKKCRITVMRISRYEDLMARYENPISHACDLREGQVFVANGWQKPQGLCQSAWDSMSPFVLALSHGGENLYDGWMRNPRSAMISCNARIPPGELSHRGAGPGRRIKGGTLL